MRTIVDVCLSVDPRIKRIKQEEKEAREAKKRGKAGTPQNQKAKEEEEKKMAEVVAKRKEEEEKVCEIIILLLRLDSRQRRLPGSKRRKIKPRLPTQRRRLAGQHEPQQSNEPLHNHNVAIIPRSRVCTSWLETDMTLCFPWFMSNLPGVLAWGSVLGRPKLRV